MPPKPKPSTRQSFVGYCLVHRSLDIVFISLMVHGQVQTTMKISKLGLLGLD